MKVVVVTVALALAFAVTKGFHDASNAIATLVATRGATPAQAVVLLGTFNLAGVILLGTAVASTIGSIVDLSANQLWSAVASGLVVHGVGLSPRSATSAPEHPPGVALRTGEACRF